MASSRASKWPEARRILPKATWKSLTVDYRSSGEEIVNGRITRQEGQAVGQLEDVLVQRATVPQACGAQSCLVDQLKCQARLDTIGLVGGPRAE